MTVEMDDPHIAVDMRRDAPHIGITQAVVAAENTARGAAAADLGTEANKTVPAAEASNKTKPNANKIWSGSWFYGSSTWYIIS